MKKMIILLVFVTSMQICFAQDTANLKSQPLYVKEDYLKKSKHQKTAAIVMVSVGAAMFITGAAIAASEMEIMGSSSGSGDAAAGVIAATGVAAMLGSIPLFISAKKNRKRALSVSFQPKSAEVIQGNVVHLRSLPSVNFSIRL